MVALRVPNAPFLTFLPARLDVRSEGKSGPESGGHDSGPRRHRLGDTGHTRYAAGGADCGQAPRDGDHPGVRLRGGVRGPAPQADPPWQAPRPRHAGPGRRRCASTGGGRRHRQGGGVPGQGGRGRVASARTTWSQGIGPIGIPFPRSDRGAGGAGGGTGGDGGYHMPGTTSRIWRRSRTRCSEFRISWRWTAFS